MNRNALKSDIDSTEIAAGEEETSTAAKEHWTFIRDFSNMTSANNYYVWSLSAQLSPSAFERPPSSRTLDGRHISKEDYPFESGYKSELDRQLRRASDFTDKPAQIGRGREFIHLF